MKHHSSFGDKFLDMLTKLKTIHRRKKNGLDIDRALPFISPKSSGGHQHSFPTSVS